VSVKKTCYFFFYILFHAWGCVCTNGGNVFCLRQFLGPTCHHSTLNGTVFFRVFLLLVFFMNQFPPSPEYHIRTVSNFSENLRRYSQVKVHHRYQRHWRQILPPVLLVLLIPVANLPPVSMILVANNGNNIRLLRS
jgi:hypothetical protein